MRLEDPPGPVGIPLIGNMLEFRKDRMAFLIRAARTYGDVVHFRPGPFHAYLLNHPDHIRDVLVGRPAKFLKNRIQGWMVKPLLGKGMIISNGEDHRRQRRAAQPAFAPKRIDGYCGMFVRHAEEAMKAWGTGGEYDIDTEMLRLAMKNLCEALFNANTADISKRAEEALPIAIELLTKDSELWVPLPSWLPTRHNRKKKEVIRGLTDIALSFADDWRKSGVDRGDLLSMLMLARDEKGCPIAQAELRDHLVTMFAAGYETTAFTLIWAWILIAQHPSVEAALHAELDRVLGGRAPTAEDLPKLTYTSMVLKETLRLYPAAWVLALREPVEDVAIGGYRIRKGSFLFISPYIIQRDPRYFDDPERFDPERFSPNAEKEIPRGAYLPFGIGPRVCIGQSFSQTEALLVLATLAQHYRVSVKPGQRLDPWGGLALRPPAGVRVRITPRTSGARAATETISSAPA